MSIVTLCPQCKTAFAIQAEHYSAADAWVRCGRCAHVFEVDQHLFEIDSPQEEVQPEADDVSVLPASLPRASATHPLSSPVAQPPSEPNAFLSVAVSVVAVVLLGFQVMLFHRDKLVAMNLSVAPIFTAICQTVGCRVDWPKENEKVAIDSSHFKQLGEDKFSFTLSVKNQASYFLAMPALELTLTNGEEGDVVRKVWLAPEVGLPDMLKPMRSQTVEMVFAVDQPWAGKINGYRALLFYP
jgi:predicted Zn finger-like uncharacterized protein